MKTQAFKAIMIAGLLTFIAIPTFANAEDLSIGGSDVNGAVVSEMTVGGSDVNGATTNQSQNPASDLSVGGQNVNGVDAGLSVGGQNVNGSQAGPDVGGTNTNGSQSNVSSNPSEDLSVGGQNVNGSTSGSVPVTPPVTPPTNGGGNGSGGSSVSSGGSSSSSSGSRMTIFPTALPIINSLGQCEYITTYMKLGGSYEVSEVTKLQNFLKGIEAIDVAITGIYDEQTANAVKAFQAKYVNDVMLPWGVTTPSGQVYFTTKKKINEIYCKANFALTAEQVAQIEAYKLALANGTLTEGGEVITSTSTTSANPEVGSATTSSQTAAVADTSFFSKVWDFIKGIFGR